MELRDVVVCVKGVVDVEGGGACLFAGTHVEDMLIFRIIFLSSNQKSAEMLFRG